MNRKAIIAISLSATLLIGGGTFLVKENWFKVMNCNNKSDHTHIYQGIDGYKKYLDSHYKMRGLYNWTEDMGPLSEEILKANKEEFLPVSLNKDLINNEIAKNQDYVEYYCKYESYEVVSTDMIPMTSIDADGNISIYYIYSDNYDWVKRTKWTPGIVQNWGSSYRNVVYNGDAMDVGHRYTMYDYKNGEFVENNQVLEKDVFNHQYFKRNIVREVRGNPYTVELNGKRKALVIK